MRNYSQSDYPYTLFVNGKKMPIWTNAIWCAAIDQQHPLVNEDFEDFIYPKRLERFISKLDKVGNIESEHGLYVKLMTSHLLLHLLDYRDECLEYIQGHDNLRFSPKNADNVWEGMVAGMVKMSRISTTYPICYWCVGYDDINQELSAYLESEMSHTEHNLTPPHLVRMQYELTTKIEHLEQSLYHHRPWIQAIVLRVQTTTIQSQ